MTYDELNTFILNYLENDITGRAIMLTGKWGSGKSYYVKNNLKPFLESKKHKCAIVSLYGLSDVSEISKAIYTELRTLKKETESETGNTAKVVGKIVSKTIINGLVSKIGFEIGNISNDDLQKVYESIDLSGKLIILEDIERTQIDIIELLGYTNNMCENDGVKVLLVTNENELFATYNETTEEGNHVERYTDDTIAYIRAKEKTVGDTVRFECDYLNTIQQIIRFFSSHLQKYCNTKCAEDIRDLFVVMRSYNLRAFIYGCQKSERIFEFISREGIYIKDEIEDIIFYGILAFTQRQSQGVDLQFENDAYLSGHLGLNDTIPLFRFCFDFIVYQSISKEEVKKAIDYYTEYLRKGKWNSGRDKDLQIVKSFYLKTEYEIKNALVSIPEKIKNGTIPYYDYGVVVNYLVAIKYEADIDFDIKLIVQPIIESLRNITEDITFEALFSSGYTLYNNDGIVCFEQIKNQMKEVLCNDLIYTEFPYDPTLIKKYSNKCIKVSKESLKSSGFAHKIDVERFVEMLKKCSADIISELRSLFMHLYTDVHYSSIVNEDVKALKKLRDSITMLKDYNGYDKIQRMQIKWLDKNLSDIIAAYYARNEYTL